MKTKVVFFFPWREVSGGPAYLTALADDLAERGGCEVFYVDYDPGLSDALLRSGRVTRLPYTVPFSPALEGPVVLVTPIYSAMHIPALPPDARLLFVNWHNFCIDALVNGWRLSPRALEEFLGMVARTDSEFFLDRTHWLAQDRRMGGRPRVPERYVPVKGRPSEIRCRKAPVRDGELHAAALGRLCRDKIYSVLDLIGQLERSAFPGEKHLHVIGEGEEEALIRERMGSTSVRVHLEGTLTGDVLRRFLAERTDVLFSMGMSVLEGAAVALPSVVMPHNVVPFHADAYVFLQDCADGTVGWYDTQLPELGYPIRTLDEVLREVCTAGGKERLGRAALEHFNRCHGSNVEAFERALSATSLRYEEFARFAVRQRRLRLLGIPVAKLDSSFDGHIKTVSLPGVRDFMTYRSEGDKRELLILGKPVRWLMAEKEGEYYRLYVRIPFIKA